MFEVEKKIDAIYLYYSDIIEEYKFEILVINPHKSSS